MNVALLVALGGAAGALGRFGLDALLLRFVALSRHFPVATLAVNVVGSFLIGAVFAVLQDDQLPRGAYDAAAAGLAGGLTTFSTFSTATAGLWLDGRRWTAAANLVLNFGLSVAAVALGRFAAG